MKFDVILVPVDFWSRITHIVEMLHPLELGEEAERKRVAQDYVRLFWLKNIESNVESGRLLCDGDIPLYTMQQKIFASGFSELAGRIFGDFVAREIAEIMCGPGQPLPSIRTIRGTVSRCFNLIFNAIFYSRSPDAALQQVVFSGTTSAINLSFVDPEKEKNRTQQNALEELRSLIRASATIQI